MPTESSNALSWPPSRARLKTRAKFSFSPGWERANQFRELLTKVVLLKKKHARCKKVHKRKAKVPLGFAIAKAFPKALAARIRA
jgi:hypothetical protein